MASTLHYAALVMLDDVRVAISQSTRTHAWKERKESWRRYQGTLSQLRQNSNCSSPSNCTTRDRLSLLPWETRWARWWVEVTGRSPARACEARCGGRTTRRPVKTRFVPCKCQGSFRRTTARRYGLRVANSRCPSRRAASSGGSLASCG